MWLKNKKDKDSFKRQELITSAVHKFPIVSYLSRTHQVFSPDSQNPRIICPVCKTPKLAVNRDTKLVHCPKCNEGGHGGSIWNGRSNLLGLICLLEDCSKSQAFKIILETTGTDLPQIQREIETPEFLLPDCISLKEVSDNHEAKVYLRKRAVGHLIDHCYAPLEPRYFYRVIIPCTFLGELEGFEAKSCYGVKPKALYETWFKTYDKIYTSVTFDPKKGYAVITESIIDAETILDNGIGIYGSILKEGQLVRLLGLKDLGVSTLFWYLDGDAMKKTANSMLKRTMVLFDNYVIPLDKKDDPNSVKLEGFKRQLDKAFKVESELDILPLYM